MVLVSPLTEIQFALITSLPSVEGATTFARGASLVRSFRFVACAESFIRAQLASIDRLHCQLP